MIVADRSVVRRAVIVGVVSFVVFNANGREIPSYDSQVTKLLAIEIAQRHTLSLGHVVGRTPALSERPAFVRDLRGNIRSGYPLPSAFIAAAVAASLAALRLVDLSGPRTASLVAKLTASALTAFTVAFALLCAARRVSLTAATWIAVGFGFGTNMWTCVSQTLWQQETALCALMLAVICLTAASASVRTAVVTGTLLGIAGLARPQLAPTVAVLSAGMVFRWGRSTVVGWIPIVIAAGVAIGVNLLWFGHPLGAVPARESLHLSMHAVSGSLQTEPWVSAAGLLMSPSRGLLVFSPIVLVALFAWNGGRREGHRSDLTWVAGAAAAQFTMYSCYAVWWGGHTYGPRYLIDVVPLLVPLAAAAIPALTTRRTVRSVMFAALAWSVCVSAVGAFVYPAEDWNVDPVDVDTHHERLWDWRDSQIARCVQGPLSPQNFALFDRRGFSGASSPR